MRKNYIILSCILYFFFTQTFALPFDDTDRTDNSVNNDNTDFINTDIDTLFADIDTYTDTVFADSLSSGKDAVHPYAAVYNTGNLIDDKGGDLREDKNSNDVFSFGQDIQDHNNINSGDRGPYIGDYFDLPFPVGTKSDDFGFSNTQNTNLFTNQYTGRSTNDIFYEFTLTVPMNVTITHEGSVVNNTYLYLLDNNGNLIVSNDNYNGEGHCSNTLHSFIRRQLAAGTYYVVSEGYSSNGPITTNIIGFASTAFYYTTIPSSYSTESESVGGLGASFGVSPMGGATYSIPIDVPKGVGGLQPSLTIVYNSQAGNGVAGYGTSLAGSSSITRGPKDIYHDGKARGLTYLADDALYLDGKRLILSSGTPGQDGAVYTPESDPFTRVIAHGNCTSTSNNTWYEVLSSDGMIYRYGHNDNSRLSYTDANGAQKIHSWYLSFVQQAAGNYMTYSYQRYNNCMYLSQITYGGNTGQTTTPLNNVIEFNYVTRDDVSSFVFDGQQGCMDKRLSSITCKTNDNVYRTYTLNYNTTGDETAVKFSRLVEVTAKNNQNKSLPAARLNWSYLPVASYASYTLSVNQANNLPPGITTPFPDQIYAAGDMNGDGFADIVGIAQVGGNNDGYTIANIYYSSPGTSGNRTYSTPDNYYYMGFTRQFLCINSEIKGQMFIDIDGDGINEMLLPVYSYVEGDSGLITFYVIGQNFNAEFKTFNLFRISEPLVCTADFNLDGKSDIAYLETMAPKSLK